MLDADYDLNNTSTPVHNINHNAEPGNNYDINNYNQHNNNSKPMPMLATSFLRNYG
jgi:hypothetical protein